MEHIETDFRNFIDNTPNAYLCVDNLKKELIAKGYVQLYENEDWESLKNQGNYFVVRGDSSLIAFRISDDLDYSGFNIVATHGDSPSFSVKPNPEMFDGKYLKLNVGGYGGMINYSWLDRPLSLAGRVVIKTNDGLKTVPVNIDKDLLIIPSQAIHINRSVNDENKLNHQTDMLPVMSLTDNPSIEELLLTELSKKSIAFNYICDYDLYLYNRDKLKYIGVNNELILAPRLDDLACLYPAFRSFLFASDSPKINVFCAFNNEEIGSMTMQGADSSFLLDVLSRIASVLHMNIYQALNGSFIISADNSHAIHPSASGKSDPTNTVELNKGVVIKHHKNYTTDAVSSSVFKEICDKAAIPIPYQDFACRSDMLCGSTLGGISQKHVSIDSVDIGLPQLAMHSANETIGSADLKYMYDALLEFYNSTIIKEKDTIRIRRK